MAQFESFSSKYKDNYSSKVKKTGGGNAARSQFAKQTLRAPTTPAYSRTETLEELAERATAPKISTNAGQQQFLNTLTDPSEKYEYLLSVDPSRASAVRQNTEKLAEGYRQQAASVTPSTTSHIGVPLYSEDDKQAVSKANAGEASANKKLQQFDTVDKRAQEQALKEAQRRSAPTYAMLATLTDEDEVNEYLKSINQHELANNREELNRVIEQNRGLPRWEQELNILTSNLSDDYKISAIYAYDPKEASRLANMTEAERQEEYRWLPKYGNMDLEQYEKALADAETAFYGFYTTAYNPSVPASVERYKYLNAEYEWLLNHKDQAWMRSNRMKYEGLRDENDFESKSATDFTNRDSLYMYINNIGDVQSKGEGQQMRLRYGEGVTTEDGNPESYEKYKGMTEDEIATYNYLYKTTGKEAAEEYLAFAEYAMNARAVEATKEAAAQEATEHLGATSAKSTAASLLSGIGIIDAAVQKAGQVGRELFGGGIAAPVDYNTESMRPSVYANAVIQTGAENLTNKYGVIELSEEEHPLFARILNGKSVGDVYQMGMSQLNSWAAAAMSAVIPGSGLALLSGSAATSEMLRTIENGGSDTQALAMGFAAGFAEYISEKLPMDNLLKGNWTEKALGTWLKQSLLEGGEEVFSGMLNWAADAIIMAQDSDWKKGIQAYVDEGMSEEAAARRAFGDKMVETLWDFVGGFALGGMGGPGRIIIQKGIDTYNLATVKRDGSIDAYRTIAPDLVTRVLAENKNDKLALSIQAQIAEDGNAKNVKANDLYRLVMKNGETVNKMLSSAAKIVEETANIVEKIEAEPVSVTRKAIDQVKAGKATNKTYDTVLDAAVANPDIQRELGINLTATGGLTTKDAKRKAVAGALQRIANEESAAEEAKAEAAKVEELSAPAPSAEAKVAEPAVETKARETSETKESATTEVAENSVEANPTVQLAIDAWKNGDKAKVQAFASQAIKSPELMAVLEVKSTGNNTKDLKAVRARIEELATKPAAGKTSAKADSSKTVKLESRAKFEEAYRAANPKATEAEINAAYELKASEITRDGQIVTAEGKDLTFSQFREAVIEIAKANGHPVVEGMIVDMFDSAYKTQKHKAELQEAADTVNKTLAKDNIGVTVRISYSNIEFPDVDGVQGNALFNSAKNEIVFNGRVVSVHDILSKRFGHEIFHPGANVDTKLVQQTLDVFKKLHKAGKLTGEAKRLAKNMNAEITERVRCYQLYENAIAKQEGREARNISDEDAKVELAADLFGAAFDHTSLAKEIAGEKPEVITGWRKGVQRLVKMLGIKPNTKNSVEAEMNKILEKITKALNEAAPEDKGVNRSVETKTIRGLKYEKAYGQYVAPSVAEIMNSDKYAPPPDYMSQYSVSTTQPWKENYLRVNKGPIAQMVVDAIERFTEAMIQDDAIRGYVPMGEYKYSNMGPLRTNQEYVWTFDMDTSCPRTFQFLFYRDAIQKEAGRYLTYNESINLLELMRAYGQNIPCCYCYVENKRVLLSASYNNFFKFRNDVLTSATKEEAAKVMYGYKKGKPLPEASQKALDRWWEDRSYNPSLTDVWTATNTARNSVLNFLDKELAEGRISTEENKTTKNTVVTERESKLNQRVAERFDVTDKNAKKELEGFVKDWLYDTNAGIPHIYNTDNDTSVSKVDERALALNREALAYAKSASSAKSVENYVPYTDQLKNVSEKDRAYILGMGGIRKHSSNDFRMDYVQDYFLFYADLAAGEWTGHTYTKSIDFAKIFACTNDRINLSIAFYEDKDGNITPNIQEGAPHDDVRALRNAYKNVGAMAMVTSDNQLTHALNSEWIDMIIPFHASGLDKAVWYNLRMWNDYTSKQGERFYNATTMKNKLKAAGVAIPKGAKAAKVKELYDEHFKTKRIYDADGNAIKPHFFPGDTYVKGHKIPGHHNDVNRYFQLCEEYGVHPRFYGTTVRDTNGKEMDVTEHPSYIKLIKETSRTDTPQEAIEFNFGNYDEFLKMTPFEYAMMRLKEEAKNGGFDNMRDDSYGIVKEFIKEYLDKDRPLGYLTERAKNAIEARNEISNQDANAQFKSVSDLYRSVSVATEKKKPAGNVGYHAGDLGKSEHLGMISGDRDSGHFGFGTYFVGNPDKLKGYNRRNGQDAPIETVDFSQYNLYKPATNSDGTTLHRFLQSLNTYYDRDPNLVQTPEEYEQAKENIDDYRYEVEEEGNVEFEEQLIGVAETVLGKYGVAEIVQRKMPVEAYLDKDGSLELSDGTSIDIMDAVAMIDDVRDLNIAIYKEVADNWTERRIYRYDGWRYQVQRDSQDLFNLSPAQVDKLVAEIRDEIAAGNYNWETAKGQDSASTRFMKKLGYEGIDVRHLSELDNTFYGSVIYDLKGDDLARKNEIGTAKYSLSATLPSAGSIEENTDSIGATLTPGQKEYFKDSKVRDSIGRLIRLFHGTQAFGFTALDFNRSDDGISFFMTDSPTVARSYSGTDDIRSVVEGVMNPDAIDPMTADLDTVADEYHRMTGREIRALKTESEINDWIDSQLAWAQTEVRHTKKMLNTLVESIRQLPDNGSQNTKDAFEALPAFEELALAYDMASSAVTPNASSEEMDLTADALDEAWKSWNNLSSTNTMVNLFGGSIRPRSVAEALRLSFDAKIAAERGLGIFAEGYDYIWDEEFIRQDLANAYTYYGVGDAGNYALYANLTEPLIIEANGNYWNTIPVPEELREAMSKIKGRDAKFAKTRDFARLAKSMKKDGVIFRQLVDYGAAEYVEDDIPATVVIAFKSNSVKDVHNENPTVNDDFRYSLSSVTPAQDKAYLDAVNRGDIATARRMVDEAARQAGYTVAGYHGTQSAGFTVANGWLWMARDYGVATVYGYSNGRPVDATNIHDANGVYAVNYRLGRNLSVDAEGQSWAELPVREEDFPGVYMDEDTGDISTNAMAEWAFENGYDSITFRDVDDEGYTTVDVVFDPNRDVKSANPATYDDNGNVIPLSERFNTENSDIRYSLSADVDWVRNAVRSLPKRGVRWANGSAIALKPNEFGAVAHHIATIAHEKKYKDGELYILPQTDPNTQPVYTARDKKLYNGKPLHAYVFVYHGYEYNPEILMRLTYGLRDDLIEDITNYLEVTRYGTNTATANVRGLLVGVQGFTAGNPSGNVGNRQPVGYFGNGTSPSGGVRQGNGNQRAISTPNHGGHVQGNVGGSGASGNQTLGGAGGLNSKLVTPEEDAMYLAAVARGDMAEAQRLVDVVSKRRMGEKRGVGQELNIYIKDGHTKDGRVVDFANAILDGIKKGETRVHKSLTREWVGIAKDGMVIGRVRFGEPIPLRKGTPEYRDSLIAGTEYDIEKGSPKYYYPVEEVMDLRDNPRPIVKNGNYGQYQLKSNAPVTYDNDGNVIPLSKRFDTTSSDINYSVSPTDATPSQSAISQKAEAAVAQATSPEVPTAEDIGSVAQTGDPVGTVIYHKDEVSEIARAVANDEALSALLAQYGVIPQTGSYYREAKVPRRTEAKNRVSKTAVTVMGAEATPESRIPTIKQAIVDGKMSYAPTTNQRDLQAAKRTIYRDGWDAAMSDWTAKVRSGRASSKLVALGATFLDNMDGDEFTGEQYVDVLMDYAQLLRNAGQVVQAAKILKNLTPAGKLYGIQRQINKYNEHGQLPPIEGWIDGASDYLSSRLERLVKVRPENMRADDEARLVVKILYDFAKDSLPKNIREANRAKVKERRDQLVMDRIQSLFDNKEEYTRLWNATKEKFAETMGETPIDYVDFDRMMEDLSHYTTRLLADAKFGGLALDPKLAEAFLGAKTDADRDAILEMIYADLASQVKATGMEKFTAWRYLSMLGNFRTQVRNVFGNLFFQFPRMASVTFQGIVEAGLQKAGVQMERTTSALYDMDTFKYAFEDFKEVRDIILGGGKYQDIGDEDLMQRIDKYRTIFKSKILEGYRKATANVMDKGDEVFCSFTYADSLARFMKANGTTWNAASEELREKARTKAVKDAAEATYRDNNQFAEFISRIGKPRNPNNPYDRAFSMMLQGVLPFRKTPANILVRAFEYSPASLLTGAVQAIRKASGNDDISGADIVRHFSQGLTGTGLVVLGFWFASMGNLIGKAPDDDKERELWEMQGYQEYALVVKDKFTYTLDWLAPECIPLFLGANLHQASLENGLTLSESLKALSSLTDPMLSMSMLQGVNDALENATTYGDDAALTRFIGNALWSLVTQNVPTVLGQLERGSEQYRMSTYIESGAELSTPKKLVAKLSSKIPGWDNAQIIYTDAWGRMQENPQSATLNYLYQMFSPGYVSTIRKTDMEAELLRLYNETGETSVMMSQAEKYFQIDGERKNLTGDEYYSYNIMRGQTALSVVTALTESDGYAALDAKGKVSAISKAKDYATQIAKYELTNGEYNADKWVLNTYEAAKATGLPVSTVVLYRCLMSAENEVNNSSTANKNVRNAIFADTSMTVEQKSALDEIVISDGVYLVQDKTIDYSSSEGFAITQMSDGAQKRWESVRNQFHISTDQYAAAWAVYNDDSLKADEKKRELAKIVGSTQRGNLLYSVLGKKLEDK